MLLNSKQCFPAKYGQVWNGFCFVLNFFVVFFFCYFCLCEIFAIVQSNTSHSHLKLLNDWLVGWLVSWMLACLLNFCWQFLSKMPNNCHSIVWVSDSYTPSQFNSESVCGCGCDCGYDYSDGGCDCDSVR